MSIALSERDRELLNRLFVDPSRLPMPFKTWLIAYLETSDLTIPISSVVGLLARLEALEKRVADLETP